MTANDIIEAYKADFKDAEAECISLHREVKALKALNAELIAALERCEEELSIQAGNGTSNQYEKNHPAQIAIQQAIAAIAKAKE